MRIARLLSALIIIVLVTGCAHPLAINPDIVNIEPEHGREPIAKNVGYYIAPNARDMAVETPGGGGDKVTYKPYNNMEAGIYKMLSNVFQNVTLLQSPDDTETIQNKSIAYIITPNITTTSSSSSAFTWPPTHFSVTLMCDINDSNGKHVAKESVLGEGHAEYEEFKSDFSLAGKRAAQDALLKMQSVLLRLPALRK